MKNIMQFNRIKNQALSRIDKQTATLKYMDINNLLDNTYIRYNGQVFKFAVDFGVIIERVDGCAEAQTIKYKYLLPTDANSERRVPLEIRSEQSFSIFKQYFRKVVGTTYERTNTGGAAIPSLNQHIKRREIYCVDYKGNPCFWTAYSFVTMSNTKDKQ
ncbi:MAG: hypothetical protein EZS28_017933 [Streblomastix strix]|uniref:Uncharacterized protein n=1 Tax=Streblomastix strix TaxID=222440 RepID=A0A5J4VV07_9EUKA|nr:MAG: hypothetical protein EZS28_017933 [Streblomastix strix]